MTLQASNYPATRPSLDLNFAATRSLSPLITFTRNSTGTYFGADRSLKTAVVNEPRFDHNPTTGESLGLLVEEQRTNSIRNNTMQGAVAGTPGTLPTNWSASDAVGTQLYRQIVGTGVQNGINYIDIRYSGTVTTQRIASIFPDSTFNITASASQAWAGSAYLAIVGGSTANVANIRLQTDSYNTTPTFRNIAGLVDILSLLTPSLTRFSWSGTTASSDVASVRSYISIITAMSGSVDITLRIGMPQLEQGGFATSVIPTTGTAATRNADVASITETNFSSWYRQDEGALFAVATPRSSAATDSVGTPIGVAHFSDGTSNERIRFGALGTSTIWIDNNSTQADLSSGAFASNQQLALASAYKANDFALVRSGGLVQSDNSGTLPTVTQVEIGRSALSAGFWTGTIGRIAYWPVRLPNATLQVLTQ